MPSAPEKSAKIAQGLGRLNAVSDRGFALAIHIRYTRPTLLYQTYDQAWADHYSEKGLMLSDPVVHWGLTNSGWVEWSSLTDRDPEGVIAAAVAHGLTHGWTYSVGSASSRTIAGLPRSTAYATADRVYLSGIIDEIHALTEDFDKFPLAEQDTLRGLTLI